MPAFVEISKNKGDCIEKKVYIYLFIYKKLKDKFITYTKIIL